VFVLNRPSLSLEMRTVDTMRGAERHKKDSA
jgi:hypothetical protein